jgi:hypothetical protein
VRIDGFEDITDREDPETPLGAIDRAFLEMRKPTRSKRLP